jgi:hypothetical protein
MLSLLMFEIFPSYSRDSRKVTGKRHQGENNVEELLKRYAVVSDEIPMTRVFHFTAGHAARDFARKLVKEGIQVTIVVEFFS